MVSRALGQGCPGLRLRLHCWLLWLLVTCRILGGVLLRCLVWSGLVVRLLGRWLPIPVRVLWITVGHGCAPVFYGIGIKTIRKYKGWIVPP